jgi:hypothetical protein
MLTLLFTYYSLTSPYYNKQHAVKSQNWKHKHLLYKGDILDLEYLWSQLK